MKAKWQFNKIFLGLFCCVFTICLLLFAQPSGVASADMGPKPSVHISFDNMGEELCYGTLLSKYESAGPYSAKSKHAIEEEYIQNYVEGGLEIYNAFVNYEDADGFYFLQVAWRCDEKKSFAWTYYPPTEFKILLYYPSTDTFVISDSYYERYAFSSYYSVNMEGINIDSVEKTSNTTITPKKDYDYGTEILFLFVRLVITLLLEIGIAMLFGYRRKEVFLPIIIVNVITQVFLNVALNIINYYNGSLVAELFFFLIEAIIFIAEAVFYAKYFYKKNKILYPKWKSAVYALTANAVSASMGFVLAFAINAMAL